jgi:beta-N-acetylhexosaminidase
MRKWILPSLVLLLMMLALGSIWGYWLVTDSAGPDSSQNQGGRPDIPEGTGNEDKRTTEKPIERDAVQEKLDGMSLDEKLGQMVLVGLDGYEMDESARQMIEEQHVGGFILFKSNIKSPGQLLSLLNQLKRTNSFQDIPLFLAVDEEGGEVSRMPEELRKIPSSGSIGQKNRPELSYAVGSIIAEEIKAFGFNVDFAPVLDINSNPQNPIIGSRAFGSDADTVRKHGIQAMKGIGSQNVIPVVKHFPGHGDTSVDSHIGLPVVKHSLERLESFEFVPFAEAIRSGADAVMVGHILLEQVDARYPASLSEPVIQGLLRKKLGFDGVVITDDMTMGAVTEGYPMGEAAILSVQAGSDIVLVCHTPERRKEVMEALGEASRNNILSKERIDESVYRILKLKQKYGLSDQSIKTVDVKKINQKMEEVLK